METIAKREKMEKQTIVNEKHNCEYQLQAVIGAVSINESVDGL